jgi:hypothetical protein
MTLERKPVGVTAPYRPLTAEDEEFNRVERESRVKQEMIRAINKNRDDDDDIQDYKRGWVPLNWGDIPAGQENNFDFMEGARWAEKYLKEKNNA